MKKYLLMPVIFGILSFVKLEAAPMDAYYCFSTTEDAVVVEKMDNFIIGKIINAFCIALLTKILYIAMIQLIMVKIAIIITNA